MIVYVESNFVLEIARRQAEAVAAEALLEIGQAKQVQLVVPIYAICEPFSALSRAESERNRFVNESLSAQLRDLRRSTVHRKLVGVLEELRAELSLIARSELEQLEKATLQLLTVGTTLGLDAQGFSDMLRLKEAHDLSPSDAMILATILHHASHEQQEKRKCFVSRDRDFGQPELRGHLRRVNCTLIGSFGDAIKHIRAARG